MPGDGYFSSNRDGKCQMDELLQEWKFDIFHRL